MTQKTQSDFLSSHKHFDKEFGIYQNRRKKNRRCLPKDPTLLEFYDLIPSDVVVGGLPLSESRGTRAPVFSIAYATSLSDPRKNSGCGKTA